jgi:hypothetical protein
MTMKKQEQFFHNAVQQTFSLGILNYACWIVTVSFKRVCMFMPLYVADDNAHREFGFTVLSSSSNESAPSSQHEE